MTDWPSYESHKIVKALPVVARGLRELVVQHEDGTRELFEPNLGGMAERAQIGDYAILYPDGFKSVSPRKAFEEGYTRKP